MEKTPDPTYRIEMNLHAIETHCKSAKSPTKHEPRRLEKNNTYLITSSQYLGHAVHNNSAMVAKSIESPLDALSLFLKQYLPELELKTPPRLIPTTDQEGWKTRAGSRSDSMWVLQKEGIEGVFEVENTDLLVICKSLENGEFFILGGEKSLIGQYNRPQLEKPLQVRIHKNPPEEPIAYNGGEKPKLI